MEEKKKDRQKIRLKGQLKFYMQWPAIMAVVLVALNIWIYAINKGAGLLMGVFVLIYIILSAVMYLYTNSLMVKDLIEFAAQYGIIQNTLLKELAVPYAILLEDGKIIWLNSQFEELIGDRAKGDTYISKIMPELNRSIYPRQENDVVHMDVFFEEREYQAELRRVSARGFSEREQVLELPEEKEYFIAVYLQDVTNLNRGL